MSIEMTSRERVLTAARRKVPDRIPRTILLETGVVEKLGTYLGTIDLTHVLKDDLVWISPHPPV